ncbi:swt-7 [Pristionchus pacificus]|uniref:Sugar transporter SWEET n=1 Tax=Pristionchus pacificus TaxID=54126 RepID=A0A2A6CAD3_PRIPA|nr:swt-7 [Pristionchus pacificus]|eukprot:PDM75013.1 swt-7 [Pristionchus pacificus]
MEFLELFGMWLGIISMGFMILPMAQVKEWRARGSTDGFSSVHLILPVLMMGCWLRHGFMTADNMNIIINSMGVVSSAFYIAVFAVYTKDKSYLYTQLGALGAVFLAIFAYVGTLSAEEAPDAMGKIAAVAQNAGIVGGIYQIKTVIETKTTEYMPASMQFGILFIVAQWTLFGVLSGNMYMAAANIPGLIMSFISISLYVIYPPITWRVPILGTQQAPTKKSD